MRRMYTDNQLKKFKKPIDSLVDANGNPRFIEGDITPEEVTGVTFTYAKWSLSGSHLMIVLAGNVANGATLTFATWAELSNLPKFIKDKIVATFSDIVEYKSINAYAENWTSQGLAFVLVKGETISIVQSISDTFAIDGAFRLTFDLLIDTAQ